MPCQHCCEHEIEHDTKKDICKCKKCGKEWSTAMTFTSGVQVYPIQKPSNFPDTPPPNTVWYSTCCSADIRAYHGDEGTKNFTCESCRKPCDIKKI